MALSPGSLRRRPDMNASCTHSLHAAVLACAGRSIPAFHYMVAVGGGKDVPLVPYSAFGTEELASYVAEGLSHRRACLMAHHGAVAIGETLVSALELAHEVEVLADTVLQGADARQRGDPLGCRDGRRARALQELRPKALK